MFYSWSSWSLRDLASLNVNSLFYEYWMDSTQPNGDDNGNCILFQRWRFSDCLWFVWEQQKKICLLVVLIWFSQCSRNTLWIHHLYLFSWCFVNSSPWDCLLWHDSSIDIRSLSRTCQFSCSSWLYELFDAHCPAASFNICCYCWWVGW